MTKIKPQKLKKGDTIGILAVSGRIKDFERIQMAKFFFENEGFNVVISDTCKASHRYMAGNSDRECIDAFHNFFSDKNINAIFCARGGYGTLRLIDKIDWDVVKNNPKIFAGYSDITVLLAMIFKKTGMVSFHSAMPHGDFSLNVEEYTKNSFFNTLYGLSGGIRSECGVCYHCGHVKGILWGGNLASLVSLCGTDFIPDEDIILFLEDLNEPVYKIDKMLTQLFNIEKIKNNVKGIALGEFENIDNQQWFDELMNEFKIPCAGGFKITHGAIKDTLAYGIQAEFDANNRTIVYKEKIFRHND